MKVVEKVVYMARCAKYSLPHRTMNKSIIWSMMAIRSCKMIKMVRATKEKVTLFKTKKRQVKTISVTKYVSNWTMQWLKYSQPLNTQAKVSTTFYSMNLSKMDYTYLVCLYILYVGYIFLFFLFFAAS